MKQQNKKQNAGVWIDNQKAMIITSDNDGDYTIKEKLKADENFASSIVSNPLEVINLSSINLATLSLFTQLQLLLRFRLVKNW